MPEKNHSSALHELRLDQRKKLSVSGVQEVDSFDENMISLRTVAGLLLVRGEDLHLQSLSIEGGLVTVEGTVQVLCYEEGRKEGGFFRRIFG